MRPMLIAFCLLSGAAQARDCSPPDFDGMQIRGLRAFSDCVIAEIDDLRRENADLRREIGELQKSLADLPGEFDNLDGRVTRRGGERLTQAGFAVTARNREGVAALRIDQTALEGLCATGCTITLTVAAVGLREADPAPVFVTGPCAFRYNAKSGVWARGGTCGEPVSGIDGNGKPTGNSGGEIVAAAGDGCLLADSDPRLSMDADGARLGRDHARGLFLIADPAVWTGDEERFRCELKIDR